MNDVNMLDNKMISKLTKRYSIQTLFAVAVMSLVVILIKTFAHVDTLVYPLVVSVVFTLVIEFADVIIWKFLAKNSVDTLPTFFSAVSGFRMLLAIATLIGCYISVGRDAMLEYCLVFLVFYLWVIVHHSVFFSHVSNNHIVCDKDNK